MKKDDLLPFKDLSEVIKFGFNELISNDDEIITEQYLGFSDNILNWSALDTKNPLEILLQKEEENEIGFYNKNLGVFHSHSPIFL